MPQDSRRFRVLIVDDNSDIRQVLQLLLEGSGQFEVVGQAGDGEEAVKVAFQLSPDVVVMDVMMPKKDGAEACREILDALPDTRVVILTAFTEADAVIQAVAAGATGCIQKVTDMERFVSTVKAVAEGEIRIPNSVLRDVYT